MAVCSHGAIAAPQFEGDGLEAIVVGRTPPTAADEDVERTRDEMNDALFAAVKNRDVETIRRLLDQGDQADVNAEEAHEGKTPLHLAAESDAVGVGRKLLSHGASVDAIDKIGRTPLHLTVGFNALDMARLLLSANAKVDARDYVGRTPLHLAAWLNSPLLASELLANNASRIAADGRGRRPLHFAAGSNSFKVAAALLEQQMQQLYSSPLPSSSSTDVVLEVDARDDLGQTALHYAAKTNSVQVASQLLSQNAAVDAKDWKGLTPLDHANLYESEEVANLLIIST